MQENMVNLSLTVRFLQTFREHFCQNQGQHVLRKIRRADEQKGGEGGKLHHESIPKDAERVAEKKSTCGKQETFYFSDGRGDAAQKREWQKALGEKVTPNCRMQCAGCGAAIYGGGVCYEGKN